MQRNYSSLNESNLILNDSFKNLHYADSFFSKKESTELFSISSKQVPNIIQFSSLIEKRNPLFHDAIALCIITGIGLFGNLLTIISILSRKSLRKVINMFLLHHCFINLTQCLLFIPFIIALLNESQILKGCEILGGTFVTMVTANVLNIAAMTACEAYRFEDFLQQNSKNEIEKIIFRKYSSNNAFNDMIQTTVNFEPKSFKKKILKKSSNEDANNNSTASYACVIFGLIMIWLSSIILHLGITLIGSDSKQFYNHAIRNCFFAIGDRQTYILYIMWILLTAVSLALTIIYVRKIYQDVSSRKKINSKFFVMAPSFYQRQINKRLESPIGRDFEIQEENIKGNIKNIFSKSFSLSYSNLDQKYDEMSKTKNNIHPKMKKYNYDYYSHSASDLPNFNSYLIAQNNLSDKKSSSFIFGSNSAEKNGKLNCSSHNLIGLFKREKENSKRRYDIIKQILQRIKIQFLVIKLFIICWIPLFFTVAIDAKFEVHPSIYRYLTIIAFSNSSLTPFCYLTILIPCINKFCFPCLRTDGKQSIKKTAFYDSIEKYYEKLGNRFHNLSGESSLTTVNEKNERSINKRKGNRVSLNMLQNHRKTSDFFLNKYRQKSFLVEKNHVPNDLRDN